MWRIEIVRRAYSMRLSDGCVACCCFNLVNRDVTQYAVNFMKILSKSKCDIFFG